jgi:hypothetical protein
MSTTGTVKGSTTMKFKAMFALGAAALLIPVGVMAAPKPPTTPQPQISEITVDLGAKGKVRMKQVEDRGSVTRALEPGQYDPEVYKALDEYFSNQQGQAARQGTASGTTLDSAQPTPNGESSYWSGWDEGYDSYGRSYSSHSLTRNQYFTYVEDIAKGFSSGSWKGSTTPQSIKLNETLCFSGVSLTVSWPPSLSGSGYCHSYASDPWTGRTYVSQSYSNARATSRIAVNGTTQYDNAVIRVNSRDYRPFSQVSLP